METLRFLKTNLVLERYRVYLERTAEKILELRPTSIISLARKGPRLLQLMKEMGISLPSVPHWSDHALDLLTSDDIGTRPIIFDDVVILGTSLHSLQKKIREHFKTDSHIVAVIADSENFRKEFVENIHPIVFLDEPNTQSFSSELIRTIPLLGLPYDLDHPIYSFGKDAAQALLDELFDICTHAHKECLSAQYADEIDVLTLHFDFPVNSNIEITRELLGNPDLFKIKIMRSRIRPDIRFVPICCFPPIHKRRILDIWKYFNLPDIGSNHLAMYRILCFVGAESYAEACSQRLNNSSLLIREAQLTLGTLGAGIIEQVKTTLYNFNQSQIQNLCGVSDHPLENDIDSSRFCESFPSSMDLIPKCQEDAGCFERITDFWRNVFHKIELPFRIRVKEFLDAGESIDKVLELKEAKRLMSGFPARQIFKILELDDNLDRSLAFDLAVDAGIQVPMYFETKDYVARVYHHGESEWEGYRFCSLIAKVFDVKKKVFPTIAKIKTEKYLHTLYELTSGSCKQEMFQPVQHFLERPYSAQIFGRIKVDSDWRAHGVTLGVADKLRGRLRCGEDRFGSFRPAVYWLFRKGVFREVDGGYALNEKATEKFHCKQNMIGKEYRPVAKLFEYLEKMIPSHVETTSEGGKQLVWSHDDIIRLLSSCPNTRIYLRSIAEDAILMSDDWNEFGGSDDLFVASNICRESSGEIFKKMVVHFSREKILSVLQKHAEMTGTDDDFELLILPLFVEKEGSIEPLLISKIEDRCQIIFICVESVALDKAGTNGRKRRALIEWLIKEKSFQIPDDIDGRIALARRTCYEVKDMFPILINSLMRNAVFSSNELYVFSDMRDSSQESEKEAADNAKENLIDELNQIVIAETSSRFRYHVNNDLNDEKNVFADSGDLVTKALQKITRIYSSHGKYARIGIVTNRDTLESATMHRNLPSSSTNFALAKKLGHFLQESDESVDGITYKNLDKRHVGQKHGIIVISKGSEQFVKLEEIFPGHKCFHSVSEFYSSTHEGWVRVNNHDIDIAGSNSPRLNFTLFLYR